MRPNVSPVMLSADKQAGLRQMLRAGRHKARTLTRARIRLHAHDGKGDKEIVAALGTRMGTVGRVRTRVALHGLDAAWYESPRPGGTHALDGGQEAYLVALACRTPHKAATRGPCNCWRMNWSRSGWSRRSATKRCDAG